jgi:hypothetical protein
MVLLVVVVPTAIIGILVSIWSIVDTSKKLKRDKLYDVMYDSLQKGGEPFSFFPNGVDYPTAKSCLDGLNRRKSPVKYWIKEL